MSEKTNLEFKDGFELNGNKGESVKMTYKNKNAFKANLPIEESVAKKYDTYKGEYVQGFTKAAIDETVKYLKENSETQKVTCEGPFGLDGRGGIEVKCTRSVEQVIRSFSDPSDVKRVKTSDIRVKVTDYMASLKDSEIKAMKKEMTKTLLGE